MTGRCHGPGCRVRTDLDFHAAECAAAWHSQFWKPDLLPEEDRPLDLERRFAELGLPPASSCPHTHPAPSVVDEIRAAYIQHIDLPGCGPFQMTRWQRDLCLVDADDGTVRWRTDDTVLDLSAGPIELVDRVEDSTPYRLWCERRFGPGSAWPTPVGATFPQVASEESQVAQSGKRAWFRMRRTR